MKELRVSCPSCHKVCEVHLEEGDLEEGQTTEGFEWPCRACHTAFSFDVHVEILNKKTL